MVIRQVFAVRYTNCIVVVYTQYACRSLSEIAEMPSVQELVPNVPPGRVICGRVYESMPIGCRKVVLLDLEAN